MKALLWKCTNCGMETRISQKVCRHCRTERTAEAELIDLLPSQKTATERTLSGPAKPPRRAEGAAPQIVEDPLLDLMLRYYDRTKNWVLLFSVFSFLGGAVVLLVGLIQAASRYRLYDLLTPALISPMYFIMGWILLRQVFAMQSLRGRRDRSTAETVLRYQYLYWKVGGLMSIAVIAGLVLVVFFAVILRFF